MFINSCSHECHHVQRRLLSQKRRADCSVAKKQKTAWMDCAKGREGRRSDFAQKKKNTPSQRGKKAVAKTTLLNNHGKSTTGRNDMELTRVSVAHAAPRRLQTIGLGMNKHITRAWEGRQGLGADKSWERLKPVGRGKKHVHWESSTAAAAGYGDTCPNAALKPKRIELGKGSKRRPVRDPEGVLLLSYNYSNILSGSDL